MNSPPTKNPTGAGFNASEGGGRSNIAWHFSRGCDIVFHGKEKDVGTSYQIFILRYNTLLLSLPRSFHAVEQSCVINLNSTQSYALTHPVNIVPLTGNHSCPSLDLPEGVMGELCLRIEND
jgi:hypothetical protein